MGEIKSFRDLLVWQKSMDLAELAYRAAKLIPKAEEFRLTSQLLRAVASVPSNIAEGHMRGTRKDYTYFVTIARGSLAEVETLLRLAVRTELLAALDADPILELSDEVGRMLTALHRRLSVPSPKT